MLSVSRLIGDGRDFSPSRWALPITAFRVVPPKRSAIWLADNPSTQSFRNIPIRVSLHSISTLLSRYMVVCPSEPTISCANWPLKSIRASSGNAGCVAQNANNTYGVGEVRRIGPRRWSNCRASNLSLMDKSDELMCSRVCICGIYEGRAAISFDPQLMHLT